MPSTPAVLTQKGCRYIPHVLALHVNQEVIIKNEDEETVHNVHPLPKLNREWNESQTAGHPLSAKSLPRRK